MSVQTSMRVSCTRIHTNVRANVCVHAGISQSGINALRRGVSRHVYRTCMEMSIDMWIDLGKYACRNKCTDPCAAYKVMV